MPHHSIVDLSADWDEAKEQVIARLCAPDVTAKADIIGLTGLEVLSRVLNGDLPIAPFHALLGLIPIDFGPGSALFQAEPSSRFYNPMGTVHGGYAATLLDTSASCAIHTMLPANSSYATLDLNVHYVRPITESSGTLRIEGELISLTRQIGTAQAKIRDKDNKLFAHATATCMIFPLE